MRRQYAQLAQQPIQTPATPQVGMVSLYFNRDDEHPYRIDDSGSIWPVGGVRLIDEGGQVGWTMSTDRTDKSNIGKFALDFSLQESIVGVGASGDFSIAIGTDVISPNTYSIGVGYDVEVLSGVSIGHHLRPVTEGIVLGKYNAITSSDLFQFGVGSSELTRQNAFEINQYFVPRAPLADAVRITNPKDLVTLEKLESEVGASEDYDEHTFSIKGTLENVSYPGFFPYIPTGRSKKVIGIRWRLKSGSCTINLVTLTSDLQGIPIYNTNITSGFIGQIIESNPTNYFDLVDGREVVLSITNNNAGEDLSVTVILLNE